MMDSSFHFNGSNGIAIGPFSDCGRICYLQDDGKMIAAGDVKNDSNFGYTKMGLVRYDNNGELDLSCIEHDAAGNLYPEIVSQKRELIVLNDRSISPNSRPNALWVLVWVICLFLN